MKKREGIRACHIECNDLYGHLHHVTTIMIRDTGASSQAIHCGLTSNSHII